MGGLAELRSDRGVVLYVAVRVLGLLWHRVLPMNARINLLRIAPRRRGRPRVVRMPSTTEVRS
jgi:hypothetical protein